MLPSTTPAEYKQVTVLFADVVRSMDIASTVGAERLREIMTKLVEDSAAVVQRYGGTVDKFTGDGIMAVFGAPLALEDHAFRACLAALEIQEEAKRLAFEVERCDGVDLQLRVGLNSGEVIAGEIGSGALGYTAIGEHVGMAQRMESAAPSGGVMLSESTARLVEQAAMLGRPQMVQVKGADGPLPTRVLLATKSRPERIERSQPALVGRMWELNTITGILDEAINGVGCVVSVQGPPGIGKSRIVAELAALAVSRSVEVFTTYCESHASNIPFHAVARLLRVAMGLNDLDGQKARARVRAQVPNADPEDLLLLDDLLGIADSDIAPTGIEPDARRRRLTALINGVSLARTEPAVYVIEDAHWIDEVSESMLAEFLTVIPQTPSMVLITYRPEYHGALTQIPGTQAITLRPLSTAQTSTLTKELLGSHPSVDALAATIAQRAAGNPFFAEEIVRDLAERGVLDGERGVYVLRSDVADVEVSVPGTLQATIAARIDRLDPEAKRTISAAAVIGSRFDADLLTSLGIKPALDELIDAELIDQVRYTPCAEYAFRHPLIRTVAYESQLKSGRSEVHRRLAAAIEDRNPGLADENAALIATHLEAAGDLHESFGWHMRAGTWSNYRDLGAARMSWHRAAQVADRLPAGDPERTSMRIAPRTLLCGSTWRSGGGVADTGFDELRDLCTAAGDRMSLAIGMVGMLGTLGFSSQHRQASQLASEFTTLVESLGDPTMTVALLYVAAYVKWEAGEVTQTLRVGQQIIDLADGDPSKGDLFWGSPLAYALTMRGIARMSLGQPGWNNDFEEAVAIARTFDPLTRAVAELYKYALCILYGALLPDAAAVQHTAEALQIAEQLGDDFTVAIAQAAQAVTQAAQAVSVNSWSGADQASALELLTPARNTVVELNMPTVLRRIIDVEIAREKARIGDLDGALELARTILDEQFDTGEMVTRGVATTALVEALLHRDGPADLQQAQAAVERLAAVPTDPGFVLHELPLLRLRALLARAHGDEAGYRDNRDRYRKMATSLDFQGHIAMADAMG
jgi:adenylate cyclase